MAGASFVISPSPTVLQNPYSYDAPIAGKATFKVRASGSPPLSYQWRHNGLDLPGAVEPELTVQNIRWEDRGLYTVSIKNSFGFVESRPAGLGVLSPPWITKDPQSQSVSAGTNVTFTVTADGTEPYLYQWLFNDLEIPDAVNRAYTITNAQKLAEGRYSVRIRNAQGSAVSSPAQLSVEPMPPRFVQQPQSTAEWESSDVALFARAVGSEPFAFQWLKDGVAVIGATNASFLLRNARRLDAGEYRLRATNSAGTSDSSPATVEVRGATKLPGNVDPNFYPGIVDRHDVQTMALDSEGRILIGSDLANYTMGSVRPLLRLEENGALDSAFAAPAFGGVGPNWARAVYSILPQPDGFIVVGGVFSTVNGFARRNVARLRPDGDLDLGFETDLPMEVVGAMAFQADGKLLIGGSHLVGASFQPLIYRLNTNGTRDVSFQYDSVGPVGLTHVSSFLVQADGKIIIGGPSASTQWSHVRNGIARLNPDGSVDRGFGLTNGVWNAFGASGVAALRTHAGDSVLLAGSFTALENGIRYGLARLKGNGLVDDTLYWWQPIAGSQIPRFRAVDVQADQKILIAGDFSHYDSVPRQHIARLNPDGRLDVTFRSGSGPNWPISTMLLSPDGSVLIGGLFTEVGGFSRVSVARLIGGDPPPEAPAFQLEPTNQATMAGRPVFLEVEASGFPLPTFQWTHDGTPIRGATNAILKIANPKLADARRARRWQFAGRRAYV